MFRKRKEVLSYQSLAAKRWLIDGRLLKTVFSGETFCRASANLLTILGQVLHL